jgi:hypothetical protein
MIQILELQQKKALDGTDQWGRTLQIFDKTVHGEPLGCTIILTSNGPVPTGNEYRGTPADIKVTTVDGLRLDIDPEEGKMHFDGLPPTREGNLGYPSPGPGPQSLHFSRKPGPGELSLTPAAIKHGAKFLDNVAEACLNPGPSNPNEG